MLEKGVVSFPFTNSWYLPAFYIGNGCTLFGDGTDASAGVDFGGEKAQEVTDYLIDLESNPNFRIDADGSGIAGLRDGSINAMFSGSWDAAALLDYGFGKCVLYADEGREEPDPVPVRGGVADTVRVRQTEPFTYVDTQGADYPAPRTH